MNNDNRPSDPASGEQFRRRLEELADHNAELEKFNHALTEEHRHLRRQLDEYSRLLAASTTGLISLDPAGIIEHVNARAADQLAAEASYLRGKPINLFIDPQDQALFYINRSRLIAGSLDQPFEIKLKTRKGAVWSARIDAQAVDTGQRKMPGMLLAASRVVRSML